LINDLTFNILYGRDKSYPGNAGQLDIQDNFLEIGTSSVSRPFNSAQIRTHGKVSFKMTAAISCTDTSSIFTVMSQGSVGLLIGIATTKFKVC